MPFFLKAVEPPTAENCHQPYLAKNPHGYCGVDVAA